MWESHDLVLYRRAVTRPDSRDFTTVQRRPMEVLMNHLCGLFRGVCDIARKLAVDSVEDRTRWVLANRMTHPTNIDPRVFRVFHVEQIILPMREIGNRLIAWLHFEFREIQRPTKQAWWSASRSEER